MATTERLYQFDTKATLATADILYCANSVDSFQEVQTTVAGLIGAYPGLLSIGTLTTTANEFIHTTAENTYTTSAITSLGIALMAVSASNNGIFSTNGSGAPQLSSTVPPFNLGGTLNTNSQVITNSVTNGDIPINTNGSGLINFNSTQGFSGVSNDNSLSPDSSELIPTQSAVKAYVDAVAGGGFTVITAVIATQTTNFIASYYNGAGNDGIGATLTQTSAAIVTIDGVTLTIDQRVLFSGQTDPTQNGIYRISTLGTGMVQAIFTRATDYDTAAEILPGTLVPVTSGTLYGGSIWLQYDTVTTVGSDPIQFILYAQPSNSFVTLSTGQTITGAKNFTQQITAPSFSPNTTSGVIGTTTNDDAAAGSYGEFVSSVIPVASAIAIPSTNVSYDITSIDLDVGDWNLEGNVGINIVGGTFTGYGVWSNDSSATIPDGSLYNVQSGFIFGGNNGMSIPFARYSLSVPTTIYLSIQTVFSGSTVKAYGGIYARRAR